MAASVSTPDQALYRSTIGALSDQLKSEIGTAPALILYGPLAEFDDV
jgi:uroporphyrin-III C-methyltransferase